MRRGDVKEKSTPTDTVIYFNHLPPSVPIYASPCKICTDPSLSSFSLTTHTRAHTHTDIHTSSSDGLIYPTSAAPF